MLLEVSSLRSPWKIWLLGLLLLMFGASRGMPRPMDSGTNWQHCKNASREIVKQLWKLGVKPLVLKTNVSNLFPKKIECEDHCDPESLGNANQKHCLQKIIEGLRYYHKLLGIYSDPQDVSDLRSALNKLSFLLQKDPDITTRISPSKCNTTSSTAWTCGPLQKHTLWRLQSFSIVAARVFAHGAALSGNAELQQ